MNKRTVRQVGSATKAANISAKKKINTIWASVALAVLVSSGVHATAVIYEPFAQATGTLNGKAASSIGLTGNWTVGSGSVDVTAGSLTWGSLPVAGDRALSTSTSNTKDFVTISSALDSAGLLANGAELWFSVLVRSINPGRTYVTLGTGYADGFDRVTTTQAGGNYGYGLGVRLENGSVYAHGWAYSTAYKPAGTAVAAGVYLVVGKINWGATDTSPTTLSIYLPGADMALPATAASTITAANNMVLNRTAYTFNTLSFSAMNSTSLPIPEVDEIRFGARYLDVVPVSTPAFWDIDGETAGAGGATPSETWDATNLFWNNTADGTGATNAWVAGQEAVFAAGTDATGTYTVTVDGTQDIGGLYVEEGTVTLSGGTALRLVTNVWASVANGLTATVAIPIVEDASPRELRKDLAGTLVLSGNNTYSGVTTVNNGTLILSGDNTNTGSMIVNGGTLILSGNNSGSSSAMTLNGGVTRFDSTLAIPSSGRTVTVNAGAVAMFGTLSDGDIATGLGRIVAASAGTIAADNNAGGAFNFNTAGLTAASLGAVGSVSYTGTLTPNGTVYRLGGGGGTLTLPNDNQLTGSKTLTVSGPGIVVISSSNNLTGATTLNAGSTLVVQNSAALNNKGVNPLVGTLVLGSDFSSGGNQLYVNTGGRIRSDSTTPRTITGPLRGNANNTKILGDAVYSGKLTFLTGALATSSTDRYQCDSEVEFAGGIASGNCTKSGTGTLTLSGDSFYTGPTVVSAGPMIIGGAATLLNGTYTSTISISSGALFQYSSSATQTLSGVISGAGTLVKDGTGTLILAGLNTYSGATTISEGTLVGVAGGCCTNSAITVTNVNDTAALAISVTNNTQQWSCSSLALNADNGGAQLKFAFDVEPSTTQAPLYIKNSFAVSGDAKVVVDSANLLTDKAYPLLNAGSAPSTVPTLILTGSSDLAKLVWDAPGNTLYLTLTRPGTILMIN